MARLPRVHSVLATIGLFAALAGSAFPAHATARDDRIASLTRASSDPGLAPWQRSFYRERLDALLALSPATVRDPAEPFAAVPSTKPVWSRIAETPRRQGHSLVIDTLSGRVFVFGGRDGALLSNSVFVIDPDGAREWHLLRALGTPPSPRMGHVAVLDGANRRMLVYGGTDTDGSYLDDVWAMNLDGTPAWSQVTPAGSPPSARANHVAVVDSLNDRMLVYGGGNGGFAPLSDLWALSLAGAPAWIAVVPAAGIPATYTPSAAMVDESRHRLVLAGVLNEYYSTSIVLYFLQLDTPGPAWTAWTTPYSNSPPAYNPMSFALDPAGDRVVCLPNDYNNYQYSVSLAGASQWNIYAATGAVAPYRYGRALAVDARHRRLLVAGGGPGPYSSGRSFCDLSAIDLNALTYWTALAGEPAPRVGHSFAFDPARGAVHMFGGQIDSTGSGYAGAYSNQLWSIVSGSDSPAWVPEAASGGPVVPRSGASLIVDPARDRLILFGGWNGSMATNEVWQRPLSGGTAWTQMAITGTLPHQRSEHPAVYDPVGDRMLVFGGYDGSNSGGLGYLADLWALSLGGTPRWTRLTPEGTPPSARRAATLAFDASNGCAYLIGGANSSYYDPAVAVRAGEVWKLSLSATPKWQQIATGLPGSSYYYDDHTCAAFYDAAQGALVRVAYEYNQANARVSMLAPDADTLWTALSVAGIDPPASTSALGAFDTRARRLVWFGGTNATELGTWALSLGAPPLDVPPRVEPAAAAMRVFPNPAHGRVGVRFALARAATIRLELLDLAGRRVRGPVTAACPAGPSELAIGDVASLPAGVYFARLSGPTPQRARVAIVR